MITSVSYRLLPKMNNILFQLNDKLFVRDPQRTDMGQVLVSKSIEMIDQMGFEWFTFRKLATEVQTTEPTIYRYFANKHRLLHYLVDWYWTLINFQIEYSINNINEAEEKLAVCLSVLSGQQLPHTLAPVNISALHRIVVCEWDKTFLTKTVDHDYQAGLHEPFKETCKKISNIVQEVNPHYPFPHSLVSTTIHAAKHQIFYTQHLPILSDLKDDADNLNENLFQFLKSFVMNALQSNK